MYVFNCLEISQYIFDILIPENQLTKLESGRNCITCHLTCTQYCSFPVPSVLVLNIMQYLIFLDLPYKLRFSILRNFNCSILVQLLQSGYLVDCLYWLLSEYTHSPFRLCGCPMVIATYSLQTYKRARTSFTQEILNI